MTTQPPPATDALDELTFDNTFVRELPADPLHTNRRRQVHGACYSRVEPTAVVDPHVVACSREVIDMLGMPAHICDSPDFAQVFAGNRLVPGMDPYAACYGGHQFGNWAGQLGDGRAINLGEVLTTSGARWELQLKGAGPTPYSRSADGRAVLRSSVREFLCSEAMHHLGVPTTRALSLVTTGESILRDMFYDGNAGYEPGAVVCRVAPSFIRFGSFEILAARQEFALLELLAGHTLTRHFPELGPPSRESYIQWFGEICQRTAHMIVAWMRVGFVHGVMNTDNMSILGLTIDYGPYGWLENYDPDWTPNTTDAGGRRYRFAHQPHVAKWNLARLAEALHPLVGDVEPFQEALSEYTRTYEREFHLMMAAKLGLHEDRGLSDADLIDELLEVLTLVETDMTIFYRQLPNLFADRLPCYETSTDAELIAPLIDAYYTPQNLGPHEARIGAWLRRYLRRIGQEDSSQGDGAAHHRRAAMNALNPKYVLRNYLAQVAIDAAESGDNSGVNELLDVMRRPYDEQPGKEDFAARRPEWARHRPGCSMLSCSS